MLSFHLDTITAGLVSGWAFDSDKSDPVNVDVRCGNSVIVSGTANLPRPDVAGHFPASLAALRSGFLLSYPVGALNRFGASKVLVSVWSGDTKLSEHSIAPAALLLSKDGTTWPDTKAFVPHFIRRAANRLTGSPDPSVEQIVDTIISLVQSGTNDAQFIKYVRFLSSAWSHCRFVAKYFPAVNPHASDLDKDRLCKQTS